MKLGFVAAVAVAGLTTGAMAAGQDFTVDIGGVNSWDLEGDVDNETMSIDLGAMLGTPGQPVTVNGLGWDVTIEVSDNGSWFSEATISFGDVAGSPDIFLSPGAGDDFNDPAPMDYSGDIKLAAAMGAFLGLYGVALASFAAVFFGAAVGLLVMIVTRQRHLPFGPFLALGGILLALFPGEVVWVLNAGMQWSAALAGAALGA